jgi:hypothetical protein
MCTSGAAVQSMPSVTANSITFKSNVTASRIHVLTAGYK